MKIPQFLENLDFAYVITYSGLRGEKYKKLVEESELAIIDFEKQLKTARYMQANKINKAIEALRSETQLYHQLIIAPHGKLHKSAEVIRKLEKGEPELIELLDILRKEHGFEVASPCIPVFRDAIGFYAASGDCVGMLHLCFECGQVYNQDLQSLPVTVGLFEKLRESLIKIGHSI
ncbi:MAG: hypothetical protein MRZ79_22700 [Bacteroidia bacterium]|nr:hypothetical protein [Bacteroidia bacterium]